MKTILLAFLTLSTTIVSANWSAVSSNTTENLNAVHFSSTDTGYTVGSTGVILRTIDGGKNWSTQVSGTTETLESVYFVSNKLGFTVGSSGTILKTTNSGVNWLQLTSGLSVGLFEVQFLDAQNGWASGEGSNVIKTTDGGSTWSSISSTITSSSKWNSMHVFSQNKIVVGGNYQNIGYTSDGGNNWRESNEGSLEGTICCMITDLSFVSITVGYGHSNKGDIIKTIDGGDSWSIVDSTASTTQNGGMHFIDENNGWLVNSSSWRTRDGGLTWSTETSTATETINDVHIINSSNGIAVGRKGTIVRLSSGSNGIDKTLGKANINLYPNPTSKKLTIEIKNIIGVTLKVINTLGTELHSEAVTSGTQSLDVSSWSAGIYFLQILNGTNIVDIRKIVVKN